MTVQAWLDSERNYEAGRQLYEQLGDNARLKQVLGHGPSAYNQEALAWELQKLARAGVTTAVALAVPRPAVVVESATESLQSEPAKDFSADITGAALLIPLSQARRPLYDERTQLHAQLEVLAEHGSQEDVRQAAARIMQLSRELNANWKTDAYVRAHGQLPPPPAAAPGLDTLNPVELVKKRNSLRSQVSKLKKRPDRADDLAVVEATLSQVETLLKPVK
jgi:hypothetical protein